MFKRTLLPLITIASLHAAEGQIDHATPTADTEVIAPQADAAEPSQTRSTAQSIMLILAHLERGILIMEHDTNKECAEFMRNIAANARILLVKLMALSKIDRQMEGVSTELTRELYRTYKRFNDMLEDTYSQTAIPTDTAVDDASASEAQQTT
jgi:hypothetical protein